MSRKKYSKFCLVILQCLFPFNIPENTTKPKYFRGYEIEALTRNGLRRPLCNTSKKKAFVKGPSVFDVFRRYINMRQSIQE